MGRVINAWRLSSKSDLFFFYSGGWWMCYIRAGLIMQHVLPQGGVVWGASQLVWRYFDTRKKKSVNYERALKSCCFFAAVVVDFYFFKLRLVSSDYFVSWRLKTQQRCAILIEMCLFVDSISGSKGGLIHFCEASTRVLSIRPLPSGTGTRLFIFHSL